MGVKCAHSARQQGSGSNVWMDGCAHVVVNQGTGVVGVFIGVGVCGVCGGASKLERSRWWQCGWVNRDGSPSSRRGVCMVQLFPLRNTTLFAYYPFRLLCVTALIRTNPIHKGEARQTGIIGARAFASGSRLDTRCESAKSFRPASAWSTRPHSNIGLSVGSNIAHEHRPKIGSRNTLLPDRPSQRYTSPLCGVIQVTVQYAQYNTTWHVRSTLLSTV